MGKVGGKVVCCAARLESQGLRNRLPRLSQIGGRMMLMSRDIPECDQTQDNKEQTRDSVVKHGRSQLRDGGAYYQGYIEGDAEKLEAAVKRQA